MCALSLATWVIGCSLKFETAVSLVGYWSRNKDARLLDCFALMMVKAHLSVDASPCTSIHSVAGFGV